MLLEELMAEEFFHRQPPKSTGREVGIGLWCSSWCSYRVNNVSLQCYGKEYIDRLLLKCEGLQLSHEDIVATVTG